MTYGQGCRYAAWLGVPCLVFDLIARMPPLYHSEAAHSLAQIVLFPGWQIMNWLTGGLMARSFEYKLLIPIAIIGINILAWGGVVWMFGNLLPLRQGAPRSAADLADD